MAVFSLRTAAQQAGISKDTILQAIKAGRGLKARVAELRQSRDQWQEHAEWTRFVLATLLRPWWKRLSG